MSVTIPVNVKTTPSFYVNVESLKRKLSEYAEVLVKSMEIEMKTDGVDSLHRTSPFIDSLTLTGGRPVPTDLKLEDIYEE